MSNFLSTIAAAAAQQPSGTLLLLWNLFPFIAIILIMYVLFWRPQQQRVKQHQQAIAGVKKGDEVVTGGGIRGKVTKVTDDEAEVEIAQGVRIRVVKGTLSQVLTKNAKPAND